MPPAVERRIVVRNALLELASDALYDAVTACAKRVPMEDIAVFVEGSETTVDDLAAGTRRDIAELIRGCSPKGELDALTRFLLKKEPGFLPCAFVVKLGGGDVDFSVVALRMDPVH